MTSSSPGIIVTVPTALTAGVLIPSMATPSRGRLVYNSDDAHRELVEVDVGSGRGCLQPVSQSVDGFHGME